ncbi:hypothetical protein [Novipirellula aureliae]|nr:hypothetical protein [Novipirellula aureliae]
MLLLRVEFSGNIAQPGVAIANATSSASKTVGCSFAQATGLDATPERSDWISLQADWISLWSFKGSRFVSVLDPHFLGGMVATTVSQE